MSKIVKHIDGHLAMRPAVNHPNPGVWDRLKEQRRIVQTGSDGKVHCGCCWRTEQDNGTFDLHHRHYDSFGNEHIEDLILLCRSCHDAITSRIRSERFALGDRSADVVQDVGQVVDRHRPQVSRVIVEFDNNDSEVSTRFRPNFRR